MTMERTWWMRRPHWAGALLSALCLPAAGAAAEEVGTAEACAAVERAVRTIGEAERFHSRMLARTPGRRRPAEEEQIVLGDIVYASSPASGRWVKLPLTAADRRSLSAGMAAHPPRDCRDEGTQDLDGKAMRVLAYRQDMPAASDAESAAFGRLWVDAADGRPRRYEGRHGQVRVVLTVEYDAVAPPYGK
jgi:hypothetical protein